MKPAVWGGLAGIVTGAAVTVWITRNGQLPAKIVLLFWPSSILGFGYSGEGGWTGFWVGTLVLGGQALLYGGIGAAVAALIASYFKEAS